MFENKFDVQHFFTTMCADETLPFQSKDPFFNKYFTNIPKGYAINLENKPYSSFITRSKIRNIPRSALFLHYLASGTKMNKILSKLPPQDVGVYIGTLEGSRGLKSYTEASALEKKEYTDFLELTISPNFAFNGGGVVPAYLSIPFGWRGPINALSHPLAGVIHAYKRAILDFQEGRIKYAVLGATFSFDDPLDLYEYSFEQGPLYEAAALVVLNKKDLHIDFLYELTQNRSFKYGITSPLFELCWKIKKSGWTQVTE